MNRLYTVLAALLVLGGVGALIGQAWALCAVLLVLGTLLLATEFRARRSSVRVVLDGGPDGQMEAAKAQGLQNAQISDVRGAGWAAF